MASDIHFNHANIIKYCPESRGHLTLISEMNGEIIRNWNSVVQPEAYVFILGDVAMGQLEKAMELGACPYSILVLQLPCKHLNEVRFLVGAPYSSSLASASSPDSTLVHNLIKLLLYGKVNTIV